MNDEAAIDRVGRVECLDFFEAHAQSQLGAGEQYNLVVGKRSVFHTPAQRLHSVGKMDDGFVKLLVEVVQFAEVDVQERDGVYKAVVFFERKAVSVALIKLVELAEVVVLDVKRFVEGKIEGRGAEVGNFGRVADFGADFAEELVLEHPVEGFPDMGLGQEADEVADKLPKVGVFVGQDSLRDELDIAPGEAEGVVS